MKASELREHRAENYLPPGVHLLSQESEEALRRAAEKGAAITARHTKRRS